MRRIFDGDLEQALQLAKRPPHSPTEVLRLRRVADRLLERGEPFTRAETKLLDVVDCQRVIEPLRDPEPELPAELLAKVAERAAVVATLEIEERKAADALLLAHAEAQVAEKRAPLTLRMRQTLTDARSVHSDARMRLESALGRLTDTRIEIDHVRRVALQAR